MELQQKTCRLIQSDSQIIFIIFITPPGGDPSCSRPPNKLFTSAPALLSTGLSSTVSPPVFPQLAVLDALDVSGCLKNV